MGRGGAPRCAAIQGSRDANRVRAVRGYRQGLCEICEGPKAGVRPNKDSTPPKGKGHDTLLPLLWRRAESTRESLVMHRKLGVVIMVLAGMALAMFLSIQVLRGGLLDYAKATILVLPFLLILFLGMRGVWHVLPLALIPLSALVLPIYGLHQFTPLLLFIGALAVWTILEIPVAKTGGRMVRNWADAFVLLYAAIITLRFFIDRPGFVALGAAEGGIFNALYHVLAGWMYFAIRRVVERGAFTRRQLWAVAMFSLLGLVAFAVRFHLAGQLRIFWYHELAGAPAWMLCAALLPLITEDRTRRHLLMFPAIFAFLGLALVSRYRSRILFFSGQIFLVAWLGRRFKQVAVVVLIAGFVMGSGLLMVGGGRLPPFVQRSLSLFMSVEYAHEVRAPPGVLGWQDTFRAELYKTAWRHIQTRPLHGKGLGLNVEDALAILAVGGADVTRELLELGAGYHNSIINIAVNAGVPAALFFVLANILIVAKFLPRARADRTPGRREWGFAVLAFWFANMMMILINGGHVEVLHCTIMLAYMSGIMSQQAKELRNAGHPGGQASCCPGADRTSLNGRAAALNPEGA